MPSGGGGHELRSEPIAARRGFFWVGVEPVATPDGTIARGQMYVEWMAPETVTRPHPVVLVHGGGGQGLDYLGTPDGRPGWAPQLVLEGFAVYVVDRPGHGRSPLHPDAMGPMTELGTYELLDKVFVAGDDADHTQWPGGAGAPGEATMDQLMASVGPMRRDFRAAQADERSRMTTLIDQIGPAVVVTHSAGGPAGFLAVDSRPEGVAALIAVEPMGPPFSSRPTGHTLEWGVTGAPLAFDPPATDPEELADGAPRRLVNFARTPIVVVMADHSPPGRTVPATVEWLRSMGCDAEQLRLSEHGVHGNGHAMMLERNNAEVLAVLIRWMEEKGFA
jgi:pimeloyl-ACP methyl ester carboxylesterase